MFWNFPMLLIQHSVKIWLVYQHSVNSTASWLVDIKKYWEGNFDPMKYPSQERWFIAWSLTCPIEWSAIYWMRIHVYINGINCIEVNGHFSREKPINEDLPPLKNLTSSCNQMWFVTFLRSIWCWTIEYVISCLHLSECGAH